MCKCASAYTALYCERYCFHLWFLTLEIEIEEIRDSGNAGQRRNMYIVLNRCRYIILWTTVSEGSLRVSRLLVGELE